MKGRIVISALIFILLFSARALFPEEASKIRESVVPAISRQASLREDFIALGQAISGERDYVYVWERLINAKKTDFEDSETPEPTQTPAPATKADVSDSFELSEMVMQNLRGYEVYASIASASPAPSEAISSPSPSEAVSSPVPSESPSPQKPAASPEAPIPPETVPMPSPSPVSKQAAKIEEFLSEQAAFSDHAIPANVSYEAPSLPFEFDTPYDGLVTSGFGYREHPINGGVKFHYGTDLNAYEGAEVLAFADGTVISVQEFDGYGLTVIVEHSGGFQTLYAHCSKFLVERGDKVKLGDKIALAGHSGRVTGAHLHFEIIYNGKYLNPEFYL